MLTVANGGVTLLHRGMCRGQGSESAGVSRRGNLGTAACACWCRRNEAESTTASFDDPAVIV